MSIANSYAKALFEAAQEQKVSRQELDTVQDQLYSFENLIQESRELRIALLSPLTTAREKVHVVETLGKKLELQEIVIKFLALVARKERFSFLGEVGSAFRKVRLASEGGVAGQLVAEKALPEADIQSLAMAFGQKLGKKVAFQVSTDPTLLAGIKVTLNGVTYDGTLRSQLLRLRDYFVAHYTGATP